MGETGFYEWLINKKHFSHFTAKDTISRCNRVKRMIASDNLSCDALVVLNSNEEFKGCSKYVKSQLRRSVALISEYQEER